ncbi:MAG: hydroxyethylthiazole kinase [Pseudomonadota bacterium]
MEDPSRHLEAMRSAAPLVQCLTNFVAMNVAANVLLAAGASPAMVHARGEAAEFARVASAVTVNIGTLDDEWADCMALAAEAARDAGTPWVLDPVAIGATGLRRRAGARLMALRPAIVRGNASEVLALCGADTAGRGADAADTVAAAETAARALAARSGAVVAVTGPVDFVTNGNRAVRIEGGHVLMPKVTALGCALTGLTGAFAAVAPPFEAAVAALGTYAAAGAIAGDMAAGPGTFQVAFLDALHALRPADLEARARIAPA